MNKNKIVKGAILIIIILSLGIWIASRWDTWFVSAPEVTYKSSLIPDRITLLPSEDFDNSRIVTWRCGDNIKDSHIELSSYLDTVVINAQGAVVESRGGKDAFYRVKLNNLKNDSIYKYRVYTDDKLSEWYSFRMPSKNGIKSFIYIGDVQDTIGGTSKEVFSKIFNLNNDIDACIFGGDLIEAPMNDHWKYVWNNLDGFSESIPIISAPGNHEYIKSIIPYLDKRWEYTFAYDKNGAENCEGNYYISSKDVLFMVINTHSFMRGITIPRQYSWIKNIVSTEGKGKWKILVMHHPIKSVRKGKSNFVEKNLIGGLVDELGINVVLQGHEHGYARIVENNSLYVVSHCSPKHYKTERNIENTKIIADTRMYQRFDIHGDSLIYRAYDANTEEKLDSIILNNKFIK